ncbi:hypothetical protein FRB97_009176 [Tulasnella sp. 331]|nr:hypothetical protein FRB98_004725 [Tulasnella sp. 332]KAG8881767.1 hypothetical protein FRB97_009176 [Tulasnella sp. 331]
MSHHATFSDATSVTSPTPFSPFSSAYSTASEATVVSDGQADLGAFTSVFFALSQLQLQHSSVHSPREPLNDLIAQHSSNSTLPNTPNVRPYSMSPLSLAQRSTPSDAGANPDSSGDTESVGAKSDTALTASSAADDGDEESLDALTSTSPHSHSSSDPLSNSDDKDEEILEYDPSHGWTLSEISPYLPTFQSSTSSDSPTSGSPRYDTILTLGGTDESGPSLGEFSSAFEFFAAERAKLAKHLDAVKSNGDTPTSLTPSLPDPNPNPKKKGKKAANPSKKKQPITAKSNNVSVVAHFSHDKASGYGKAKAVFGHSAGPMGSSDDVADSLNSKKKQPRGMLLRPPKQVFPSSKSYSTGLSGASSATKVSNSLQVPSSKRPANHRHTRSLPVNASAVLSSATPLSSSAIDRIKSLAKRLTFHFPADVLSLRRVIANPEAALGFGSHATPSDDSLVAGGFYEPVYGADGITGSASSGGSFRGQNSLLYIFIDQCVAPFLCFSWTPTDQVSRILVDSSNILIGYLEWLKKQKAESFPGSKRPARPKLSHSALVLLLARGRQSIRKVLVASSPLHQSLDEIAGMGYQISVLQRVEIKEGATGIPPTGQPRASHQKNKGHKAVATAASATNLAESSKVSAGQGPSNSGSSTESDSGGQRQSSSGIAIGHTTRVVQRTAVGHARNSSDSTNNSVITPAIGGASTNLSSSPPVARPRFREEAVDELLQLKLLQTLLDTPSPPPAGSTIVLASGDAARSQFNPQGFLGCVKKAVERGWKVEVVGWDEGRSRAYGELMGEVERGEVGRDAGGSLSIISLDRWGLDLIEV